MKTPQRCKLQKQLPSFQMRKYKEHQEKRRIAGEGLRKPKSHLWGGVPQMAWSVSELKDWAPVGLRSGH